MIMLGLVKTKDVAALTNRETLCRRTFNFGALAALLTIGCNMDERLQERLVAAVEKIAASLQKMEQRDGRRSLNDVDRAALILEAKDSLSKPSILVVDEHDLEFDDDAGGSRGSAPA